MPGRYQCQGCRTAGVPAVPALGEGCMGVGACAAHLLLPRRRKALQALDEVVAAADRRLQPTGGDAVTRRGSAFRTFSHARRRLCVGALGTRPQREGGRSLHKGCATPGAW